MKKKHPPLARSLRHMAAVPGEGDSEGANCEKNNKQPRGCEISDKRISSCDTIHNIQYDCENNNNSNRDCAKMHNMVDPGASANIPQNGGPGLRLNRAIAAAGAASRRKADELIKAGHVRVNGETELNPACQVTLKDRIELDGRPLDLSPPLIYLMLNKPTHVVTTAHDPQGRKTVLDLLPPHLKNLRVYPVGRLDYFSEGLLLLTNDGALANRLMHPRHHLPRLYEVRIRGAVPDRALAQMENGMCLEDGTRLLPVRANSRRLADGNTLLCLELRQGVNRQIRRMCDQLGLVILSLKRVAEGSLDLGNLKSGEVRELAKKEVDALYQATHLERKNSAI